MTTTTHADLSAAYDLACNALEARALDIAKRLAGPTRVHRLSLGFAVMFGATDEQPFSFVGPGLVELRFELAPISIRAMTSGQAPKLSCSPRAFSLGNTATLEHCQAQGAALVDAAQFGRTLLDLLA